MRDPFQPEIDYHRHLLINIIVFVQRNSYNYCRTNIQDEFTPLLQESHQKRSSPKMNENARLFRTTLSQKRTGYRHTNRADFQISSKSSECLFFSAHVLLETTMTTTMEQERTPMIREGCSGGLALSVSEVFCSESSRTCKKFHLYLLSILPRVWRSRAGGGCRVYPTPGSWFGFRPRPTKDSIPPV